VATGDVVVTLALACVVPLVSEAILTAQPHSKAAAANARNEVKNRCTRVRLARTGALG
jgi:hypothetical protein